MQVTTIFQILLLVSISLTGIPMAQANWDFPVLTTVRKVIDTVDEILGKAEKIREVRQQLKEMEGRLGGDGGLLDQLEGDEGRLDQLKERSDGVDVAPSDPANGRFQGGKMGGKRNGD